MGRLTLVCLWLAACSDGGGGIMNAGGDSSGSAASKPMVESTYTRRTFHVVDPLCP